MLSYRHSFHAGNFADVIKHVILTEVFVHLIKKDSPFDYIDTHAGAGLYDLNAQEPQKLQEYMDGIGKLSLDEFPELHHYFHVIQSFNDSERFRFYPGSPAFAKFFLRQRDKGWLFELHPKDFELLHNNFLGVKNIRIRQENGFNGLKALIPPISKRGFVLVDPSYEIKSDYEAVVDSVVKAHKKFSHGVYAIWYPVVNRRMIIKMEKNLIKSGIRNIQRFELGVSADSLKQGMTSSGMMLINPPWTLFEKMSHLLPKMANRLTKTDKPVFKCDIIVGE